MNNGGTAFNFVNPYVGGPGNAGEVEFARGISTSPKVRRCGEAVVSSPTKLLTRFTQN